MWTASCSMWPTIPTSDMCCQFATTGGPSGRKTHTVEPRNAECHVQTTTNKPVEPSRESGSEPDRHATRADVRSTRTL